MTEAEFNDLLRDMTRYGSNEKTLLVRCTCPTPEGCTCHCAGPARAWHRLRAGLPGEGAPRLVVRLAELAGIPVHELDCPLKQEPDEEGSAELCEACIKMKHTEPGCMIYILQNWKPGNAVDLRRSVSGKLHTEDEFSKFPPNRGRLKLIDGTEVLL